MIGGEFGAIGAEFGVHGLARFEELFLAHARAGDGEGFLFERGEALFELFEFLVERFGFGGNRVDGGGDGFELRPAGGARFSGDAGEVSFKGFEGEGGVEFGGGASADGGFA